MIPFEALLPYGIMFSLLTICGGGLSAVHYLRNDGKRDRWNVDAFDRSLIERDIRLTGRARGQSDSPIAPKDFKLNSVWKLEKPSTS
ncbi:hypothetical protein B9G98_04002 [Wickerhamiella sorbophila]|uniref:NADH dehydrogenase [ubiquinone] 1 alpha subcomplex subunit 1 n=1 Tax=Wickerhamiella sorbophila TaxID=45607 RepID=A0A2T0FN19_9ASCO|nr:hypothetical protein B9G98_04002 [Wickerhamiella sorbophila]PRT56381.1 hypothetical protein B9G98_04002 [Wickerhamiella sorbophila]